MAGIVVSKTGFGAAGAVLVRAGKNIIKNMKYINEDAAIRFCQVYDAATVASVSVGTTIPTWIMVAAQNGGNDDFVGELVFDNGIVVVGTTAATNASLAATTTQHFFAVIE